MSLTEMVIQHRIVIETIYMALIVISSIWIFFSTMRLYHFSKHRGIKYFGGAFLFLAITFLIRYVLMVYNIVIKSNHGTLTTGNPLIILMEFSAVISGAFLVYSQIWRKIKVKNHVRVKRLMILGALIVSLADFFSNTLLLLYVVNIALFLFGSFVCYRKYMEKKGPYRKTFFVSMVLFFLVWVVNLIGQYTIDTVPAIRMYVYIITVGICTTFLVMVKKLCMI